MNLILLLHLGFSGIYLAIILFACMEYDLSDMIEAFYERDARGTFLFIGSLMTGFFFWLLIFLAGLLLKCRMDENYFQNTMKKFGIIKNDEPINLQQEIRIKQLEDEVEMLNSDINFLRKQITREN